MSKPMISEGRLSRVGRAMWQLYDCDVVSSTNDLARDLPGWSAVCARCQMAGRGRFGRAFVSDPGGLWLSAVLPTGPQAARWSGFSLMAGSHLLRMLRDLGLPAVRLRWPNDLMIGEKKLAGILIEQAGRETLTVGLGMNVENTPWAETPALAPTTTRLADWLSPAPSVTDLTVQVLDALAEAHHDMEQGGLAAAVTEFNTCLDPRPVELLQTDGALVEGVFTGLDPTGNLRLLGPVGDIRTVEHIRVERLREK